MTLGRRELNISLLFLILALGAVIAFILMTRSVQEVTPGQEIVRAVTLTDVPDNGEVKKVSTDSARESTADITAVTVPAVEPVNDTREVKLTAAATTQAGQVSPFAKEAEKITSGKLEEEDAANRRMILNYCEHFRAAFPTRDIDFLRQTFSDDALIIVGNTVSSKPSGVQGSERVRYYRRSKSEYLHQLERIFASNRKIDVQFSDFSILRHPTMPGIYGVSLRQRYQSDRYADEGLLFLLWDFRNPAMPLIHVRTWQPLDGDTDDPIGLEDFNLQ